jgi:hypothetical protein
MDFTEKMLKLLYFLPLGLAVPFILRWIRNINQGGDDIKDVEKPNEEFNEEFRRIAETFAFLYEETDAFLSNRNEMNEDDAHSLATEWDQKVRTNSKGCVAQEWKNIVRSNFNADKFVDVQNSDLSSIKKMLREWFEKVKKVGIKPDDRKSFIVEDYYAHHRYILSGSYDIGDQIIIKSPCWIMGSQCIEKGRGDVVMRE